MHLASKLSGPSRVLHEPPRQSRYDNFTALPYLPPSTTSRVENQTLARSVSSQSDDVPTTIMLDTGTSTAIDLLTTLGRRAAAKNLNRAPIRWFRFKRRLQLNEGAPIIWPKRVEGKICNDKRWSYFSLCTRLYCMRT